jgi:hypothetical protein
VGSGLATVENPEKVEAQAGGVRRHRPCMRGRPENMIVYNGMHPDSEL